LSVGGSFDCVWCVDDCKLLTSGPRDKNPVEHFGKDVLPARDSARSGQCVQKGTNPLRVRACVADTDPRERSDVDPAASVSRPYSDDHIILEAEPEGRVGRFDPPRRRIGSDQIPSHLFHRLARAFECLDRRDVQHHGLKIRICFPLLRSDFLSAVHRGVRRVRAEW